MPIRAEIRALIILSLFSASCSTSVESPSTATPSATLSAIPTEPPPLVEALSEDFSPETVMNVTQNNFLATLTQMDSSSNAAISALSRRILYVQESQRGSLYVSTPNYDENGHLASESYQPMVCYYDEQGLFITVVNSNVYYYPNPLPLEITAANLDECMNYFDWLEWKIRVYQQDRPGISPVEALEANPDWHNEAMVEAWFLTTQKILLPSSEQLPQESVYAQLVRIY